MKRKLAACMSGRKCCVDAVAMATCKYTYSSSEVHTIILVLFPAFLFGWLVGFSRETGRGGGGRVLCMCAVLCASSHSNFPTGTCGIF